MHPLDIEVNLLLRGRAHRGQHVLVALHLLRTQTYHARQFIKRTSR
jgi:hypothetical protein